jgi:hypothetical protein
MAVAGAGRPMTTSTSRNESGTRNNKASRKRNSCITSMTKSSMIIIITTRMAGSGGRGLEISRRRPRGSTVMR